MQVESGERRSEVETLRSSLAAADAVRQTRAVVCVAAERERGVGVETRAQTCNAFDVAELVLSHRARPLLDVRKRAERPSRLAPS